MVLRNRLALVTSPGFFLMLIAFFLPWYAVTCQGRALATATGWQAAVGGFRSTNDAAGGPRSRGRGGPSAIPPADPTPSSSPLDPSPLTSGLPHAGPAVAARVPWRNTTADDAVVPSPVPPTRDRDGPKLERAWLLLFPVLALGAFVLALVSAFSTGRVATRGRGLAPTLGLLAVLVQFADYTVIRAQLRDALAPVAARASVDGAGASVSQQQLQTALASAITLEPRVGWYLALFAGVVSAAIGGAGLIVARPDARSRGVPAPDAA